MTTLLIDGNNMAHRCRHKFSLSNNGENVGTKYGFLRVMSSMIHKFDVDSIVAAFDGGVPEFRRKAVPEYKANRDHGDPTEYEDFKRQLIELCDYALPMMGVAVVRKEGAEADDLLYHACVMLKDRKIVVSSDRDLFQVLRLGALVYSPSKERLYDEEAFEEEYSISIRNFIDWRAIQGDGSDNIPGVPGIGEKTATKLFFEYETLTGIFNAAAGHHPSKVLTGRIAENLLKFGFDNVTKNIYITALYADRVGARKAVLESLKHFHYADKVRVKKYLMRNAFVSLIDPQFLGGISKLVKPDLHNEHIRVPIIVGKRVPVL